jgi:hypothetical protein
MYETGSIDRFPAVGNFASYCRCVRSERTSNARRKGAGNRKNGNPYLSWAFTEAAHFARRFQPQARRFYDRKLAKTHPVVALRALAHKLARVAISCCGRPSTIPLCCFDEFGSGPSASEVLGSASGVSTGWRQSSSESRSADL